MTNLFRYTFSIIAGVIVGAIFGAELLATIINISGGVFIDHLRMSNKLQNNMYVIPIYLLTGYTTGAIARHHGKIMGALAAITVFIMNGIFDLWAVWALFALLPAMIGGHWAVKNNHQLSAFSMLTIIVYFGNGMCLLAFHIWTVLITYQEIGFIFAVFAFGFPVLPEIYWFFKFWSSSGVIANKYGFLMLILIIQSIICLLMTIISAKLEQKSTDKQKVAE